MVALFYIVSIVAANVVTASTQPLQLGLFIIPYGSLLIGLTFVLRDYVQQHHGRRRTYGFIFQALGWSALTSYLLGDTLFIVLASSITFLLSETADTEVFSRLRGSFAWRVLISGIVGGVLDSIIFVIIGLSPLGAGFLPWELVPYAIVGQLLIKITVSAIVAGMHTGNLFVRR